MQSLPLANVITLGVRDFDRECDFYEHLGWPAAFRNGNFAAFELRGAVLALFPIDQLAADAHSTPEPVSGGIRSAVIITAESPDDVDAIVERAQAAGATVTKPPMA